MFLNVVQNLKRLLLSNFVDKHWNKLNFLNPIQTWHFPDSQKLGSTWEEERCKGGCKKDLPKTLKYFLILLEEPDFLKSHLGIIPFEICKFIVLAPKLRRLAHILIAMNLPKRWLNVNWRRMYKRWS